MDKDEDSQKLWDEIAAERSGEVTLEPAKKPEPVAAVVEEAAPVVTPAVEAAATVAEVKPAQPTIKEQLAAALARVEKLEGRTRNVEGHIGGLNHQQKAMQETMTAAHQAAAAVKEAPTSAQVKAAVANPEQWERLKGDFPEWSEATEKFLDAKLAGIKSGTDEATVNKLVADGIAAARTEITADVTQKIVNASLNAVFPGWEKKRPEIIEWVKTQSDEVKRWAASTEVEDAANLLSMYTAAKRADPAAAILNTRKAKLEAAVAAPRGGRVAPAKTPDQMTPEELWNHEAKLREKARAAA